MRFFLLFIAFFPFFSNAQKKWNLALEGQASATNYFYDFGGITNGANIIFQWYDYEIYLGYNQHNVSKIRFANKGYSVLGPSMGIKYHLRNEKRKGHFFSDLNFQWRTYFTNNGTPPLGGKSEPDPYGHLAYFNSYNLHLGLGYEFFIYNRITIPLTISAGTAKHKGTATDFGITLGYENVNKLEFSLLYQIGVRAYLWK